MQEPKVNTPVSRNSDVPALNEKRNTPHDRRVSPVFE
jgi:hypothetical protein